MLTLPIERKTDNDLPYVAMTYRLVDTPLSWQTAGLSYTASGYGAKIPTRYVAKFFNGLRRRVYCTCYSNAGTYWVYVSGERVILREYLRMD